MAIARGAGTEIIRCASFTDMDSGGIQLIIGVQHHIYTVLSIVFCNVAIQAAGNNLYIYLTGYDSKDGDSADAIQILTHSGTLHETFVWNDKFSFNGTEPTDFAGPLDNVTKQDAIADQGSSVAQVLKAYSAHADDQWEVMVTYIDQNNA